jgi:hypothetical protein
MTDIRRQSCVEDVILVATFGTVVTFNATQQDGYGGELLSVICHHTYDDLCIRVPISIYFTFHKSITRSKATWI